IRVRVPQRLIDHTLKLAEKAAAALNDEIDVAAERFIVESTIDDDLLVPRIVIVTSTKNELNRQRIAKRVRQHRVAAWAILHAEGVITAAVSPQHIAADRQLGVLRVALFDDIGARNRTVGANPVWILQSLRNFKDLDVYLISA